MQLTTFMLDMLRQLFKQLYWANEKWVWSAFSEMVASQKATKQEEQVELIAKGFDSMKVDDK